MSATKRHAIVYAVAMDVIDYQGHATVADVVKLIDECDINLPGYRWSPADDYRARAAVGRSMKRLTETGHLRRTFRVGYGDYGYNLGPLTERP